MRSTSSWLLCLAMAVSAGCTSARSVEPDPTPLDAVARLPKADLTEHPVKQWEAPSQVRVQVESAAGGFRWQGEETLLYTRVSPQPMELLGVGMGVPRTVDHDPRYRFRWAFDLANAYRGEPGVFELVPSAPGGGMGSSALLIWMEAKDPSVEVVYEESEVRFFKEFMEVRRPCRVEVVSIFEGSLDCPELATAQGETARLQVSWAGDEERATAK